MLYEHCYFSPNFMEDIRKWAHSDYYNENVHKMQVSNKHFFQPFLLFSKTYVSVAIHPTSKSGPCGSRNPSTETSRIGEEADRNQCKKKRGKGKIAYLLTCIKFQECDRYILKIKLLEDEALFKTCISAKQAFEQGYNEKVI